MVCELELNAASFGMHVFKYCMTTLRTRLILEWQALDIAYPQWLTTIVLDDVYYTAVLIIVCANAFAVGVIIGIVVTIV